MLNVLYFKWFKYECNILNKNECGIFLKGKIREISREIESLERFLLWFYLRNGFLVSAECRIGC